MGLTRDQFRAAVFARDGKTCVIPECGEPAADSHHITERELWKKDDPHPEGYLLENGASLCEKHHIAAEENFFPPQALRRWLDLPTVLPKQLSPAALWDKWGMEIPRATNLKYPKTPYLPFSPSIADEDETISSTSLIGKPLICSIKMDGSNVTLTREKVAARNGDTAKHPSFDPLKALHAGFRHSIPENVIVYGEWLYAQHSIAYKGQLALPSLLMVFSVYDILQELFWSWDEIKLFAAANGFSVVPTVGGVREYDAEWKLMRDLYTDGEVIVRAGHEGIVVRNAYPFHHGNFAENVGKYVRENHIQTDDTWKKSIIKNETRS